MTGSKLNDKDRQKVEEFVNDVKKRVDDAKQHVERTFNEDVINELRKLITNH